MTPSAAAQPVLPIQPDDFAACQPNSAPASASSLAAMTPLSAPQHVQAVSAAALASASVPSLAAMMPSSAPQQKQAMSAAALAAASVPRLAAMTPSSAPQPVQATSAVALAAWQPRLWHLPFTEPPAVTRRPAWPQRVGCWSAAPLTQQPAGRPAAAIPARRISYGGAEAGRPTSAPPSGSCQPCRQCSLALHTHRMSCPAGPGAACADGMPASCCRRTRPWGPARFVSSRCARHDCCSALCRCQLCL